MPANSKWDLIRRVKFNVSSYVILTYYVPRCKKTLSYFLYLICATTKTLMTDSFGPLYIYRITGVSHLQKLDVLSTILQSSGLTCC